MNQTSPSDAGPLCRVVFSARFAKGKATSSDQNVATIKYVQSTVRTKKKKKKKKKGQTKQKEKYKLGM